MRTLFGVLVVLCFACGCAHPPKTPGIRISSVEISQAGALCSDGKNFLINVKVGVVNQHRHPISILEWDLMAFIRGLSFEAEGGTVWTIRRPAYEPGVINDPDLETTLTIPKGAKLTIPLSILSSSNNVVLVNSKLIQPNLQPVIPKKLYFNEVGIGIARLGGEEILLVGKGVANIVKASDPDTPIKAR